MTEHHAICYLAEIDCYSTVGQKMYFETLIGNGETVIVLCQWNIKEKEK